MFENVFLPNFFIFSKASFLTFFDFLSTFSELFCNFCQAFLNIFCFGFVFEFSFKNLTFSNFFELFFF